MTDIVAFALRSDYEGTVTVYDTAEDHAAGQGRETPVYQGGVVAVTDGDFNIGEALENGGGTIVVDGQHLELITRLDDYPALKRVPVPDGWTAEPVDPYARMLVPDLRAEIERRGIAGPTDVRKAQLIETLHRHDAADTPEAKAAVRTDNADADPDQGE